MEVKKAVQGDLEEIMLIFDRARKFMVQTGNKNQWIDGYPCRTLVQCDIDQGCCYICAEKKEKAGVFVFSMSEEKTYRNIYNGAWLNEEPYGVIHRLASAGICKGVADFCIRWCFQQCGNLRADTHEDNRIMQRVLAKNGFIKCGQILVENGSARIAYQKKAESVRIPF